MFLQAALTSHAKIKVSLTHLYISPQLSKNMDPETTENRIHGWLWKELQTHCLIHFVLHFTGTN